MVLLLACRGMTSVFLSLRLLAAWDTHTQCESYVTQWVMDRGFAKGWFSERVVLAEVPPGTKTGTRVHSDVPLERKPERGLRVPGTKTGTRVTFTKTTLLRTSRMKLAIGMINLSSLVPALAAALPDREGKLMSPNPWAAPLRESGIEQLSASGNSRMRFRKDFGKTPEALSVVECFGGGTEGARCYSVILHFCASPDTFRAALSGTCDSQCDSRESIRANHSHCQLKPLFL